MKKIIFVFMFLNSYLIEAQIRKIYVGKIDSVVIKKYSYFDKETSTINETLEKNKTTLSYSRKLKLIEINKLNKKIKSTKSYSLKRALLSHFDIKIIYYLNNKIPQNITYSSVTKNITIFRSDTCVFKGQINPYLENEITKISFN